MGRTKTAWNNSISTITMQIVTIIVGFITPRVMLTSYGSEINGLVSSITQFILYFNLVEAGLSSATIFSLYKPLVERNHREINSIISAAKTFYIKVGYTFTILVIILSLLYPQIVKSTQLNSLEIGLLVLVLGIAGAMEFFIMAKYRAILTADQKSYIISISSIVSIMVNCIIIVLLAKLHCNIILLKLCSLTSFFIRSFMLYLYVRSKYKYLNYHERPNNSALKRRWDALFLQIAGTVHAFSPIVLITFFCNLKIVSIYTIYNMIISGIINLISGIANTLISTFGELIALRDNALLKRAYKEYETLYYALITIIYSELFITIVPFVEIYTKGVEDVNYSKTFVAYILVLDSLFASLRSPQGMLIMSAGMYKETKYRALFEAFTSIFIGVLLAPFFGMIGILIGSLCANIYRDIDMLFFVSKNILKDSLFNTLSKQIRMFSCIYLIVMFFKLVNISSPTSYTMWFCYAIIVGVIAVVIDLLSLVLFDYHTLMSLLKRVQFILGNKRAK